MELHRETYLASKKTTRDSEGCPLAVVVTFDNGTSVRLPLAALSPEILNEALAHGLSQKLGDSYSGAKGDTAWAQAQCEATVESLVAGDWNRRGAGGDVDLASALIALFPDREPDEVREKVSAMSPDDRSAMSRQPSVKAELARIRAERLATKAEGTSIPIDF